MSEYLSRLATRAYRNNATQLLRPFVRSTSPIAGHDQRFGMLDFEGFELIGAPPDQTRSETTAGSLGEFESWGRPGIEPGNGMGGPTVHRKMGASDQTRSEGTAGRLGEFESWSRTGKRPENGTGGPTIQRKMAASAVGQAVSSAHIAPTGAAGVSRTWLSPEATKINSGLAEFAASSGDGVRAAADQNGFNEPLVPQSTTRIQPSSSFLKMSAGGDEPPISAAESARTDKRRSDSLRTQAAIRHAGEVIEHTRSARRESRIDSAGLELKLPVFVDRFEPSPGGSTGFSAAADESARIVIGRINVEVVPPVAQQVATAPQPRPMTAASVSVIGQLGGVRPNMRLSLRYR